MIDSIRLENFKNHGETHVELSPLTAFVGPNSSGKSSVLEAIRALSQIGRGDRNTPASVFSNTLAPIDVMQRGCSSVSIRADGSLPSDHGTDGWSIALRAERREQTSKNADFDFSISAEFRDWALEVGEENRVLFDSRDDDAPPSAFLAFLHGIQYVRALGHVVGDASHTKELPPTIGERGENLASVIAHFRLQEPEKIERLTHQVRQIIPTVETIKIEQKLGQIASGRIVRVFEPERGANQNNTEIVYQLLFDTAGGSNIVATHMSEGTLIVTTLLTALMDTDSSEGPQTLLIDDIDQGLHPKAQRDLVGLLRKIQEERKDLQIICTTHSPYVIDEMKAEEVILLHTDDEGIARAKKLSEHPDAERALQVLTTGAFWSAEGEDWVLGGDGATEKPSTSADSPSSASDEV